MSEETSSSEKTLPASEQKIRRAREDGNVALSADAVAFASTLAGAIVVLLFAETCAARAAASLSWLVENAGAVAPDSGGGALAGPLLAALGPLLLGIAALGAASAALAFASARAQGGLVAAGGRIRPNPGNLSPAKGISRIFSGHALIKHVLSILKVAAVGAGMWFALRSCVLDAPRLVRADAVHAAPLLLQGLWRAAAVAVAAQAAFGLADFAFTWFKWRKDLMMTRDEAKKEHKQQEGDPHVKAHRKGIGMARAMKMREIAPRLEAAGEATVVIANPTHYAVALLYVHGVHQAPVVVARGVDEIALLIRKAAEEKGVPVVENRPLARGLYASVRKIGRPIPFEHYKAVSEVLTYVMRLRRGRRG